MSTQKKKPRVRFCWECGRKLMGNHHTEIEIDGHIRTLHKQCAKYIESDHYDIHWEEEISGEVIDWK